MGLEHSFRDLGLNRLNAYHIRCFGSEIHDAEIRDYYLVNNGVSGPEGIAGVAKSETIKTLSKRGYNVVMKSAPHSCKECSQMTREFLEESERVFRERMGLD
jgi:hypothetical protein